MRILLIDDDEEEYILLDEMVSRLPSGEALLGFDLDWVSTYEQALGAFSDRAYDAYLVDYRLGPRTGLDLLHEAVVRECPAPIIMLTSQDEHAIDMAAMQLGAADYLVKGQLSLSLLERSIRYAVERRQVQGDLQKLVQERTRDLALLEKQAQELKALQKATDSLLSTLDLSPLMGQILDAAQEAIPAAEHAWLYLVDHPARQSKAVPEIGLNDPRIYRINLSDNRVNPITALGDGRTVLITDAKDDPRLLSLLQDEEDGCGVRSAVIAPLVLGQDVIGALSLTASLPSAFSEGAQNLLASFAVTATAAMHNAILYSEIQNLATTDALTGQLNRRTFFELGQREMERSQRFGRPLSGIMLDVDWFKRINDTFGHAAGDQVLVGIVERCCSVIRHVDILGRYGGDEFAILLPEADHNLASEIANRIRTSICGSPIDTDAGPVLATVSMGIAQVTLETADLGYLLKKADQALYQSKQSGRNAVSVLI